MATFFDDPTATAVPLSNETLPDGWGPWDLPDGWAYEPHGGPDDTPALRLTRTDANAYLNARLPMKLPPGRRFKVTAAICIEASSSGAKPSGHAAVEFFDSEDRYLGGGHLPAVRTPLTWISGAAEFTVPEHTEECRLMFYIGAGVAGTARFAAPTIDPAPFRWTAYPLTTVRDELPAEGGDIPFAYFSQGTRPRASVPGSADNNLRCRVELQTESRCFGTDDAAIVGDRFSVRFPPLPAGPATLCFSLLDMHGAPLGEKRLHVVIVDAATRAARAAEGCVIDRRGRTLVANRPYFPIGLYMGFVEVEELEEISLTAFNCLMPYCSPMLKLSGSRKQGVEATREVLDACEEYGIKIMFGLSGAYDGPGDYVAEGLGVRGGEELSRTAVTEFRDHPAILAWYLNDEQPIENLPRLMERRRLVRDLDPCHPIFAVMCQVPEFPLYGELVDVYGIDPYPIVHPTSNHIRISEYAHNMAEKALRTEDGMALWTAIQAHNIGGYDPRACQDEAYYRREYRDPSFEEMLAMSLLSVIRGARGFLFFSYPDHATPAFDAHKRDARWDNTKRVAQALRDLEPCLLSEADPPQPRLEVLEGKVETRAYRDEAGHNAIVIVGIGPGRCRADVLLPTADGLTSQFRRTTALGGGRYRFVGVDVCADVLR